ncbi:glycosyltransferase family 4 protein [Geofilum rubicundum]|uniref:Glycosyltransferase n=1 Tax=Geofilum rubicundum JCM 15548 TaxID=1236989 RepID=A0A0E9LYQ9_9BACT|nr:glycosyltransferase family 4 protein [Geofilum rubicundum]GAO30418.1 glycosyltransferase [Geofilum rubicundum JCM 15548]
MTILFLYTELASYFVAGVRELCQRGHRVHIVRWPVNKEAPFEFAFPDAARVYERSNYKSAELLQLARDLNPDVVVASGWVDKAYLRVCRHFKGKVPTVMSMDNHWLGGPKQQLMRVLAPWVLHRSFSHAWVPGSPQRTYALNLGFKAARIQTGFYSADVPLFAPEAVYRTQAGDYPRRFVYVGRYIKAKGLDLLFRAWLELVQEEQHAWELWCVGTGDLFEQRVQHPSIQHLGFLQPERLKEVLRETGVFVLPSRFEPWGVVVHEMAAAGFPMVVSDAVGAATQFLADGKNGYTFKNEAVSELKSSLRRMITLPDEELKKMAAASHQLGVSYTPEMWAQKVEQFGVL